MGVANKLRAKGHSTTIIFSDKKIADKLNYANKIAKNGVVIGADEVASKSLKSKNFQTGETTELNIEVVSKPEDFWTEE